MTTLREKTIAGMIWTGIGKFGSVGLSFVANMVLARLLVPADFGCVGMLHVFIAISTIFVYAGFGMALIQKKEEPTKVDYNSVFYWNLAASLFFIGLLYLCAPSIARYYEMPELANVLRVQSLVLIIQGFSLVQSSQLQRHLRFKELSIRNIIATFVGMVVAIAMALMGYGIWSLVVSQLITALTSVLLLWKMSDWRPSLEFSLASLKELFAFGGLMALSSLVETVYTNLQSLIIGKLYSATDLGYYTQGRKLESVPTESLSQIVNQVSFPVFASIQDDKQRLLYAVRRNIKAITYLNFPLMALMIAVAKPLILLLYGPQWEPAVPYFQILCISSMIYTLNTLNTNVIKSLGKSNIFFIVQLSKRVIGIGLIILGAQYGIYGLLWAVTSVGYISFIINAFVNKKLIRYGIWRQMGDVGFCYLLSALLAVAVYFGGQLLPFHPYIVMAVQIVAYVALYWLISVLFKMEAYETYKEIFLQKVKEKLRN